MSALTCDECGREYESTRYIICPTCRPLSPPEPTTHPEQRRVSPVAEMPCPAQESGDAGVAPRQADTAPDTEELAKRLEKGCAFQFPEFVVTLRQAAERLRTLERDLKLALDANDAEIKESKYWYDRSEMAERANAAMREDAERYRWLRTESWEEHGIVAPYDDGCNNIVGPELDALIDAALSPKDGHAK